MKTKFQVGPVEANPVGENTYKLSPVNPITHKPYFTVSSSGWNGTWKQGKISVFDYKDGVMRIKKWKTFVANFKRIISGIARTRN